MDQQAMKWMAGLAGAAVIGTAAVVACSGPEKKHHSRTAKRMAHMAADRAEKAVLGADAMLSNIMRSFE